MDHPSADDQFGLTLYDPAGRAVATESGTSAPVFTGNTRFSSEVFAHAPVPGQWTVVVVLHDVHDSAFRMRALLSRRPEKGSRPVRDLLPDLHVVPPFEFTWGCLPAEVVNYGARHCLRFSEGPQNVGEGALDLFVKDLGSPGKDANGNTSLTGTQYQRIYASDGSYRDVPAGQFEYHVQHGHYHHSQTGHFRLFRVVGDRMVEAGTGPKQGFCMADYSIAEWEAFENAAARSFMANVSGGSETRLSCSLPVPGRSAMGLNAGWGDVYAQWLEGQYVDFGDNPDGRYVVQAETNPAPEHSVHEVDTTNNFGYALIEVCGGGTRVDVLERGLGASPWDSRKVVVDDGRRLTLAAPKAYVSPTRNCS